MPSKREIRANRSRRKAKILVQFILTAKMKTQRKKKTATHIPLTKFSN
jgi:hypothetical protein